MLFRSVAKAFLDAGHDVAIVTWRRPVEEVGGWARDGQWADIEDVFTLWGFKVPVVLTSGRAKRDFYKADIWIDDNPSSISFSLMREPRFATNKADYDDDVLVCESEGSQPVYAVWSQLDPKRGVQ